MLCYPHFGRETGETNQADENLYHCDQGNPSSLGSGTRHKRPYHFVRDTDHGIRGNDGFGPDFAVTLTFRQVMTAVSIVMIPSNMFSVVVLGYVQEIFAALVDSECHCRQALKRRFRQDYAYY